MSEKHLPGIGGMFSRLVFDGDGTAWVKEKTCRNVHEPPKATTFWPAPHFKCSRCGAVHVSTDYVFYCPYCGARVCE